MSLKQLGALAISFAGGVLVFALARPDNKAATPAVELEKPPIEQAAAPIAIPVMEDAAVRANREQQIADLKSELATIRLQADKATRIVSTRGRRSPEDRTEMNEIAFAEARRRETDQLLAAGYSKDRIDWIRKRTAELIEENKRTEEQLKLQGKRDIDAMNSHSADGDIGLRHELGDDEYARYRQAMGRSAGLKVSEVLSGGAGEVAGLKAGDEIIAYNGVRIFNSGEINPLIRQYTTSGNSNTVDVLRNGQKIQLHAASGDLRYRTPMRVRTIDERVEMSKRVNDMLIRVDEAIKAPR